MMRQEDYRRLDLYQTQPAAEPVYLTEVPRGQEKRRDSNAQCSNANRCPRPSAGSEGKRLLRSRRQRRQRCDDRGNAAARLCKLRALAGWGDRREMTLPALENKVVEAVLARQRA